MTKVGHVLVVLADIAGAFGGGAVPWLVANVVSALFAAFADAAWLRGFYRHSVTHSQVVNFTTHLIND